MGTIEVERPGSLAEEIAMEQCVGEGGHTFEREGERDEDGRFLVYCERCAAEGWEQPDPMDDCPAGLRFAYEGETDPDYLWPNTPRSELPW